MIPTQYIKCFLAIGMTFLSICPTLAQQTYQYQRNYQQQPYYQQRPHYPNQYGNTGHGYHYYGGYPAYYYQATPTPAPRTYYQQPRAAAPTPSAPPRTQVQPRLAAPAAVSPHQSAAPATSVATAPQTDKWYTNWNEARDAAKAQGRPLVTLFVHHGCPECDKMDATLAQPAAARTLECAVKARVEFSDNVELIDRFGVQFTPTFLVHAPDGETEVYREVGALSLDRLRLIQPSIESLVKTP